MLHPSGDHGKELLSRIGRDFYEELSDPNTWFFVDGKAPPIPTHFHEFLLDAGLVSGCSALSDPLRCVCAVNDNFL